MRRLLIAAAILTIAPACSEEENPKTEGILELSGDAADGKLTYDNNCSSCHGADGTGNGSAPSLAEHASHESDSEIVTIILDGEGSMPSFSNLSDQEVANILAYIREQWG